MTNRQVAWAVALCTRAVIGSLVAVMNVLLSDGRDCESLRSLMRHQREVEGLSALLSGGDDGE